MKQDAIALSDAGIDTSSGTELQLYIGACALAYILDEARAAIHKERVRDAILKELDKVAFDPALKHTGTVPPMAAAFMCIIGLDIIHDDLTEGEIIACENKIKSKIDLIPQYGHWPAARWGTHRTWEIYKGLRRDPDDEYYARVTGQMTEDGVTSVAPNYAFARLGGNDDRIQKSAYADVLEFTGIDNRYYSDQKLKNFYRWLFGASANPSKQYHMFGDTPLHRYPANNALYWRVGRFDYLASQYAAWLLSEYKPVGHVLTYALMDRPLPEPLLPKSQLFMQGGAVFRENIDSPNALGSALYNITENAEWHTHDEVNAISVSGYGNRLLVNGGWMGNDRRPPSKNNTISINGLRHSQQVGAGLEEGLLGHGFDYACGISGTALGEDSFRRNLIQVHAREGANGYFIYSDEIKATPGDTVHAYLQTASQSSIETISAKTEYKATIDHHAAVDGTFLSIFYATPPHAVLSSITESGSIELEPSFGSHYRLEARYQIDSSGVLQTLTVLFPHDAGHPKAEMQRLVGPDFSGMRVTQSNEVQDWIYVADRAGSIRDDSIEFRASIAFVRKVGNSEQLYFARKGTKLTSGQTGFESSQAVTLLMDGKSGSITSSGASLKLIHPRISSATLNGRSVTIDSSGQDWIRFTVPPGMFSISITTVQ